MSGGQGKRRAMSGLPQTADVATLGAPFSSGAKGKRRAPLRIHWEGEIGQPQLVQHLLCLRLEAQLRRDERESGAKQWFTEKLFPSLSLSKRLK